MSNSTMGASTVGAAVASVGAAVSSATAGRVGVTVAVLFAGIVVGGDLLAVELYQNQSAKNNDNIFLLLSLQYLYFVCTNIAR